MSQQSSSSNLKILYCDFTDIVSNSALWALLELGLDVNRCSVRSPDAEYTEENVENVMRDLSGFNMAASMDFSAAVAEACHRMERPYLSWIYDSPQRSLYMPEALYDTNIIFVFDRIQYNRLTSLGIPHLYYHPLAANVSMASVLDITDDDIAKFASDISFVGNLYTNQSRGELLSSVSDSSIAEISSFLDSKVADWTSIHCPVDVISDDTINEISSLIYRPEYHYSIAPSYAVFIVLARELSYRDRLSVLKSLSQHHSVDLYTTTPEIKELVPGVSVHGAVDYDTDMFKVFFSSKINLNITMSTIESGVPQRVFDIMSVGGFVLSNDQPEICELFTPDKDIVTFASIDELIEKADFYLKHDESRIRIGINGYKTVSEKYTAPMAFSDMIGITMDVFGS